MEWPASFYALRAGEGCPMCEESGPEDTGFGLRFHEGRVSNAYLQRAAVQPGYTVVVWKGRHVVEPTELAAEEASAYWLDLLDAGRVLERHFRPVKTNYSTLGNALPHLHTHVFLRFADDPLPGEPFPFPDQPWPRQDEESFRATVEALRRVSQASRGADPREED